jgi:hypothetical protein
MNWPFARVFIQKRYYFVMFPLEMNELVKRDAILMETTLSFFAQKWNELSFAMCGTLGQRFFYFSGQL